MGEMFSFVSEGKEGWREEKKGWRGEGGEGWMEGKGKGLMVGEGKGLIEGMWCWTLLLCLGHRSSHRSHHVSLLSTCLRMPLLWCPHSLLVPCPHCRVVVLCCRCASFLYVVVMHNEQRQTTTNVVVCHLVPDVSELSWDGMGGAYHGVVLLFVVWVPATVMWHLVSISGCWWFLWWWQPFLRMWVSICVHFGAYVIVWAVLIVVSAVGR